MTILLEETSTVTAKGQTTIPKSVRQALGVAPGDVVIFRISDGAVSLHRVEKEHDDPALDRFLGFLERDIEAHPGTLGPLTSDIKKRIDLLTEGVDADFDEPIDGDVAI